MHRLLIFDFDNTLEEFLPFEEAVETDIFEKLSQKHLINEAKIKKVFDDIKLAYSNPHSGPVDFARQSWFSETFKILHIEEDVEEWTRYYWEQMFSLVRVFPGVFAALDILREHHTLCILSDSDGNRDIKLQRIEQLGLTKYFEFIFTSDLVGRNKPHPKMYLQVLEHFKVAAENCVMIGDHPQIDLGTAKELGMTTIWQKQGVTRYFGSQQFPFVDYEIEHISELPALIAQIETNTPTTAAPAPLPHLNK